jgi:tRNA A64-2'-O-ribosylphosphate transferase
MPDALSRTVPIWIAVLNRLLFPEILDAAELRTPEDVVSRSEHARIEDRLSEFVSDAASLQLDKRSLRATLKGKPLEPVWVTPDSILSESISLRSDRNVVVLCTASGRTNSDRALSNYVQGAADDSESWALGLDAATFCNHNEELLATAEDDLPAFIQSLLGESDSQAEPRKPVLIQPTINIWISNNTSAESHHADFDFVVSCSEKPIEALVQKMKSRCIHLSCTTGKVGSRQLRTELQKLRPLLDDLSSSSRILVTCHSGRDLAVGVALAILCLQCSGDGMLRSTDSQIRATGLNKATIKHRLSWIMVSMPDAVPSRATLQSVNAFLLG